MLKGAIARRYAGAIFDIGMKQKTLDRTLEDVQEIAKLFSIRKLAYLLREPKYSSRAQRDSNTSGAGIKGSANITQSRIIGRPARAG